MLLEREDFHLDFKKKNNATAQKAYMEYEFRTSERKYFRVYKYLWMNHWSNKTWRMIELLF
jgi:hypothetical protein